jgi:hypothetical protein
VALERVEVVIDDRRRGDAYRLPDLANRRGIATLTGELANELEHATLAL